MYLTRSTLIITTLILLGAGCATSAPIQPPLAAAFADDSLGLRFSYPHGWGDAFRREASVPGIDTGTRFRVAFSGRDDVSLTAFTADFREGLTEGNAPQYFTLLPPTDGADIRDRLEPAFDALRIRAIAPGITEMVHNATYVGSSLSVSYLVERSAAAYGGVMITATVAGWRETPYTAQEADAILSRPQVVALLADLRSIARDAARAP